MDLTGQTIADLAAALARGTVTSRELTEHALDAITFDDSAFVRVYAREARVAADASDQTRKLGGLPSLLAGIPVSIKDLFDVRGEPTPAGSRVLRAAKPATADAPVITRLRAAGAVIVGRTHMSEFAFSGLGTNPQLPRLANPRDPARVPGGSSSGAAASVARGQACMGLGSDTGGSTRIPAAFCGVTGWKPTQRRITREGAFPLAESLDSIGPLANSVACCRLTDALIADSPIDVHAPLAIGGLRFAVPTDVVLDALDPTVSGAFERALSALSAAGAAIVRIPFPEFARTREIFSRGTIANAESFAAHHRRGLLVHREEYDPNVRARIEIGERMLPQEYADLLRARAELIRGANARTAAYDALVFPTVGCVAPTFAEVTAPDAWAAANAMTLRNASLVNLLDRCALSIPMHRGSELPAGLMVVGPTLGDARLFAIGEAVEGALR